MKENSLMWPTISVITASYNSGEFLEESICSILNQNYPALEYIIIDGGSSDKSIDIIRKYEKHLKYWSSQPDKGMFDALNKGFAKSTGQILCWQNADDIYLGKPFFEAARYFVDDPELDLLFSNLYLIDKNSHVLRELRFAPFSFTHLLFAGWNLSSQTAFWTRRVMDKVGAFKPYRHTADFDWFLRVGAAACKTRHVRRFWGAYRMHEAAIFARVSWDERWPYFREILVENGVRVTSDKAWEKQYRLKRFGLLLRQAFLLFLQGDGLYVIRRMRKREHFLPR
jgi:glycosyltransferase involved in cell wall biosynthesis